MNTRHAFGSTLLLLTLALAGGCDDGDSDTKDAPLELNSCQYDFAADVRSGENAGLSLVGQLGLQEDEDGKLTGILKPSGQENDESKYVTVTGSAVGSQVTLTFHLPDGGAITGTGTFPSPPATCSASDVEIVGDLTGPAAGDTGDWAARYIAIFACAATCEFFGCGGCSSCDIYCATGRTG